MILMLLLVLLQSTLCSSYPSAKLCQLQTWEWIPQSIRCGISCGTQLENRKKCYEFTWHFSDLKIGDNKRLATNSMNFLQPRYEVTSPILQCRPSHPLH